MQLSCWKEKGDREQKQVKTEQSKYAMMDQYVIKAVKFNCRTQVVGL
jgi:hypothetical protein